MDNQLRTLVMDTIKWINDTFTPYGMQPVEDLLEGETGEPNSCVIARTLVHGFNSKGYSVEASVQHDNVTLEGMGVHDMESEDMDEYGRIRVYNPTHIGRFIQLFDENQYPELKRSKDNSND